MFGHDMGDMKIRMTPERLIELGEFLKSEGEKSKNYYKNIEAAWDGLANSTFSIR